ncbi:hypothetical protein BC940DRAFT_358269 [Gongronella butleri]|nr:hypothetical protein BC940DRAFT_358269 [Gongronella butleri]
MRKCLPSFSRRYVLGLALLLIVVLIWVSASFVMKAIFGEGDFGGRPFFVTYINTSTFSLYLLPTLVRWLRGRSNKNQASVPGGQRESSMELTEHLLSDHEQSDDNEEALPPLTTRQTMKLSAQFCILWFLANYTTNASLVYTTAGSTTILSSMSGLFTLLLGVVFGVEHFSWTKSVAVMASLAGIALVSWSDQMTTMESHDVHNKLTGDLLALAGAVFYGVYTVLLKVGMGDEARVDMALFFGMVGILNAIGLAPLFLVLHWLGIETFALPSHGSLWALILANAFVGTFISDFLWLKAMLLTSPLVVTLGISLTVPLAMIGDIVIKHIIPNIQYLLGAILVMAGFFAVNFEQNAKDTTDDEAQELDNLPR